MNSGYSWPVVTTASTTNVTSGGYVYMPATTAQTLTWAGPVPSGGHIPSYSPQSFAEDEVAWLRRRITEVTDLFPVAA